jgi:hypothetical protein
LRKTEWIAGLAYLLALGALPLAGHWSRSGAARTCANDGGVIKREYRVRIVDERGTDVLFCCIHCADSWLRKETAKPKAIWVTDETSGEEINANSAFFVRSLVETNPVTHNRIHAFHSTSDAEKHAQECNGEVLDGSDKPFSDGECPVCPHCLQSTNPQ